LADAFILMRYAFDSEEASVLNKQIFETIYYAALEVRDTLNAYCCYCLAKFGHECDSLRHHVRLHNCLVHMKHMKALLSAKGYLQDYAWITGVGLLNYLFSDPAARYVGCA
jgi:hypothetical protein